MNRINAGWVAACCVSVLLVAGAHAQTATQGFGTGTGTHSSQTGSTSFIPNPTGTGTTYARGGATAPNAPIVLANTGNPLSSVNSYVRAVASSSTSVSKLTPAAGYTGSTEFYTKFTALLGNSSGGTTATSGSWTFFQGAGANYTDNQDVSSAQSFAAIRFTFAAARAVNLSYRSGSTFVTTSLGQTAFSQGTVYTIEIVGNNKASGTINYTYNGVAQSVAVQKFDLYINGTLVGNDLTPSTLAAGATINAATFTGINSTGNAANLFVDDVIIYNAVPAAIGLASEPTTQATTVSFSNVQTTQMDVSFTAGNGANRLVIARSGSAPSSGPVDGTAYTADANFSGSGSALGDGKVVYSGSGSSFTLSGLSASTTYHLQVYEFNGSGSSANYLTSAASGNPNSQATQAPANSTDSDIIRASGFTEPENIAYGSYQATDITSGNSIEVARFTIRDGGAAADADATATTLDAITFAVANSAGLRRVAIYDGSTEIAELAAGATLTFSGLSGLVAADGGTKDLSLRATFNASVTDNEQFSFTVSSASANSGGSTFAAANAGGAASSTTGDRNRIEVAATKLVFTSTPSSADVAQNFSVSVAARDALENLDLDSTASVTITKASGSGTLSGGGAQNLVAGAVTFSTLQLDASGAHTLQASASGLTAATSGTIQLLGKPLAISGYMANPAGNDGPYEYVQVIALENIDFSVTPMSMVWANNGIATAQGWVNGGTITYKFNITSGTMNAGDVAYIGGSAKLINGVGTTDISGQNWLRAINTSTTAGDGFGTSGGIGGNMGQGGSADGIAIFNGTSPTDTTVPVDALFYGTSIGIALVSSGADGYVLPSNDFYSGGYLQSSSTLVAGDPAVGGFVKLNGTFNTITKTWTTPRTASVVSSPSTLGDIATGILVTTPASEPTTQASSILFANVEDDQMDVSWTSGNGANRLVIAREGSAPSSGPEDSTTYTADANFTGSGSSLGGGKVVYIGSGNSFTLSGLSASTTYHLQVYEYNGTGANVNFLASTAAGNPASQLTAAPPNSSLSDIVRASGFTEPSNIAYADYQATDITDVNSIELARFTIRDGGGASDADSFSTTLDAITFTVANGNRLRRVALYDGTTEVAEMAGANTVEFTGLAGLVAADGGTKNFSVRATFSGTVTDNQQIQFTVSSASAVAGASLFAAANAGGAASDVTGDANRIEVTATKLVFSSVPSTVTINQNFTAVVQARDALENVDLDNTASVTIIKASGSGTLTGGGAQSLVSGAQTWSSLQLDATGTFTLQASGGSLTTAASGNIACLPGPTTLAAGDIAVIGYNTGTTPDTFAILVLRELGPGTVFYMNDNEVAAVGGTSFTDLGEAEASFTVLAGQVIPAGTVIVLPFTAGTVTTDTYEWFVNTSAGFGSNNDEIYLYTAANISATTPQAFIFGVRIGTSTSQRPAGLTAGTTWITPPPSGTAAASRYMTSGATYSATTNALLSAIGDVPNNWETAASYTIAANDWSFTLLSPAAEPTVQATDVSFNTVDATEFEVTFTPGNGASRLVVVRAGSAPSSGPVDGVAYAFDADFSGGGASLGGGKVVYAGSDNTVIVTGLDPSTTYYVQVYEYNGSASTINYLTTTATGNPNGTTTDSAGNSTQSDIARASGFTEPENVDYASYQATDVTSGNSIELARFTIRDGGGSSDADAFATTLEAITFTVNNGSRLRRVALYDGITEIAETDGGNSIVFSGLSGLVAADDGTKDFSVRATFVSSVTDNLQLQFTVASASAAAGQSLFASANAGGAVSSIVGDRNRIEVTATKLTFTSVPASSSPGASFSVTVQARDVLENVDLDNAASVTITKASGPGVLTGGGAQNLVSGAQTWSSLQADTSGTITLQADGGGLTAAVSGNIEIANLLGAGDAAFVGFNADGNDDFAIVFFRDVDPNTVLYFADNNWNGAVLTSTEGTITWNSGGSTLPAGTVVSFSSLGLVSRSASAGSITAASGSFNLSASTDGLFCYRGSSASTPAAFIAAIGNDTASGSFGTLSGTGLTSGDTAILLTASTDIGQYKGARTGYTAAGYRALLNDMSNWDLQDASNNQHSDGIAPDVPFSTTSFTFSSLASEPTAQANGINFSVVLSTQITVGWTSGNGANRLVVAREGSAPGTGPVDGTGYTADANFAGSGSSLGGGKVVYSGSGSSFTLSGLSANTTYHLQVYEFNGSAGTANYLTTAAAGNPNSQLTSASGLSSLSDIVRASGFTEPANVAYASYQATDITAGNSIELARFTIRDGSGTVDADSADTTLSSITFGIVNGARLRRVAIYDGATEIAEVAGGATAAFTGLSGLVAPDDGEKEFSIRATFNASVTDNEQLQISVNSVSALITGSTFGSADAGGASSDIAADANRIEVTATKLVFSYAQSAVLVGQPFTASVLARDELNNLDLDSAASVAITKASGAGTLSGGAAQNLSSGAATFGALQIDAAGSFTLQAADGLLTAATSATIAAAPALSPGDIAIIGRINNTSPDSISIVTLAEIPAGTVVYFTDNAWSNNAPSAFRGSTIDGNGNETLMRLTFNSAVAAGTIIRTIDTGDARWTWASSGAIPFGGLASFGALELATGGDQIYAFQVANLNTNPLASVFSHVFVLDDTGAFEDPDNTSGSAMGNIPPGLSAGADTALTFPFSANNVIGLNMELAGAANFATKSEWLDFIGNQANWTTSASELPSGGLGFGLPCPPATPPRLVNPGNRTFTVGSLSSFSITANDPGCYGVTLSVAGLPSGANFQSVPSGTNTIGTISWNPNSGLDGTYPIQITATDSGTLSSSVVIRLYVRAIGEATNTLGVPANQADWHVEILDHPSSGTMTWTTTNGVSYDVYYSDSSFGGGMSWTYYATVPASGNSSSLAVPEDNKRFYSVVPSGEPANTNGAWGVIAPTIPAGYSMFAPPLDLENRSLSGSFGQTLASVMDGNSAGTLDRLMIRESNGSWTTIYLDGNDQWSADYTFARGQGFYVYRSGAAVAPRFAGPVGNRNQYTRAISSGWNMVGPSQGKDRSFDEVTAALAGTPASGWMESTADLIVIDEGGGNFRRIMKYNGTPTWLDLKTFGTPNVTILPGKAIYYFRQGSSGVTSLNL